MRRRRRKGSPAMLGEDEVEEDVAEHVSARGSTARRSRRWRRGWTRWCNTGTVDAVSRWREHGSVGHGGGRAMERDQGESAVSARLGDAREFVPRRQVDEGSGEAAAAAWRACGARRRAPACLAKPSCSLARWLGWAGRWRQVSFSVYLFSFLFFSVALGLYLKYLGTF